MLRLPSPIFVRVIERDRYPDYMWYHQWQPKQNWFCLFPLVDCVLTFTALHLYIQGMERVFNQKMGEMGKERGWCGVDSWVYGELKREGKRRGTLVVEMPSYTILCFTRVLDFSHFFDFSRIFMKNQKSKIPTREKHKKICLHYTMLWVKTRACCVFLAFLLTTLTKSQFQCIL